MKKTCYILILLLSSCFSGTTKPSKFYVINPILETNKTIDGKNITVGIDLVYIAGYLDRKEIVTIKDDGIELNISEFNRWAETLSNSIERNVMLNISSYMKNTVVKPINSFNKNFDYIILIYLNRLDGKFNNTVYLEASYTIIDKQGNIVANDNISLKSNLGNTYKDLVLQESNLISQFSMKIAEHLVKIRK